MEGLDDGGVFFSDNFGDDVQGENQINLQGVKKKFKEFVRQFHTENFDYKYRYILIIQLLLSNLCFAEISKTGRIQYA